MNVQAGTGSSVGKIEITEQDRSFMRRAIQLALENVLSNTGGPFGCVITKGGEVVADGVNLVTSTNDPSAHAEIVAIRRSCAALGSFWLTGCTIYSNSEPCPMCLGAIHWSRLERVVYACTRDDAAEIGFDDARIYREMARPAAERRIPTVQALRAEALAVFQDWERSERKIPY